MRHKQMREEFEESLKGLVGRIKKITREVTDVHKKMN